MNAAFGPFRYPLFRAVWSANLVSNFGALIQTVGATWAMTAMTASTGLVALVQSASAIPVMLLSLAAGAVADNYERRMVMLCVQFFLLAVSACLLALAVSGLLTPWLLILLTFLIGCGIAFNGPAWQASVAEMVPRPVLASAITLNSIGFNLARSAGPAVGGLVVALWGVGSAFAVAAVTPLALIAVLLRWKPRAVPRALPPEPIGTAMAAGLRYALMSPGIRATLSRAAIFGVAISAILALLPIVARDSIGGGSASYGLLLGAFGFGGVAGGFLGNLLRPRARGDTLMRLYFTAAACAAAVVAVSPSLLLTAAALAVAGATWILILSMLNVIVQMTTPRWVVGRTLSIHRMAMFAGLAAGSAGWGAVAQGSTPGAALVASAFVHLLGVAASLRAPLPDMAGADADGLREWHEPDLAVPVELTSGPIEVSIRYRIRPEDVGALLRLMVERRRIRLRDGARRWTLLRDLNDAHVWIERYATPTWADYLRHNQRRPQSDAFVSEGLRALHQGEAPPSIERLIVRQTGAIE